jgi:hypothetical protein
MKKLLLLFTILTLASTSHAYYQAEQGRWVNRDPIGERGGLNLYATVENDPANFVDFLGQKKSSFFTIRLAICSSYCFGQNAGCLINCNSLTEKKCEKQEDFDKRKRMCFSSCHMEYADCMTSCTGTSKWFENNDQDDDSGGGCFGGGGCSGGGGGAAF